MKRLFIGVLAILTMVLLDQAHALDLKVDPADEHGIVLIQIGGNIESDDNVKFHEATRNIPKGKGLVALSGPGGLIGPAMGIGAYVHDARMSTGVQPDTSCVSACAIVWLSGIDRVLAPTSHVGFHAVWNAQTNKPDAKGNAILGSFLRDLGYSLDLIDFVTDIDASDKVKWLTIDDAKRLGINFNVMDEKGNIIVRNEPQQLPSDEPKNFMDSPPRSNLTNKGDPVRWTSEVHLNCFPTNQIVASTTLPANREKFAEVDATFDADNGGKLQSIAVFHNMEDGNRWERVGSGNHATAYDVNAQYGDTSTGQVKGTFHWMWKGFRTKVRDRYMIGHLLFEEDSRWHYIEWVFDMHDKKLADNGTVCQPR